MSSILDSLKKLEKETSQQEQLPTHAGIDRKAVGPKRVLAVMGGIFLLATAIGLTAYYRGLPRTPPEAPLGNGAVATMPATPQDDRPAHPATSQDRPVQSLAKPVNREKTLSTETRAAAPPGGASPLRPVPEAANQPEKDVGPKSEGHVAALKKSQKGEPAAEASLQDSGPQPAAVQADASSAPDEVITEAPAAEKEPMQIDRLEGVGFKIQAISWSETPERRLVVINSQVLREGDGIEGYHIRRINPNDIVMQRDGKAYRLDFRSTGLP